MTHEGGWGSKGQFETAREYSDDLMKRIAQYAGPKIKEGGKEGKKWKGFLRGLDILFERAFVADEISKVTEEIVEKIEAGDANLPEVQKVIADIRKKAQWIFDITKEINATVEGEIFDEVKEALASIDAALSKHS